MDIFEWKQSVVGIDCLGSHIHHNLHSLLRAEAPVEVVVDVIAVRVLVIGIHQCVKVEDAQHKLISLSSQKRTCLESRSAIDASNTNTLLECDFQIFEFWKTESALQIHIETQGWA